MEIYENRWKTMKVIRWQEASLESSKGFYRGSKSLLTVVRPHAQKSVKTYANHGKLLLMLGMLLITSSCGSVGD